MMKKCRIVLAGVLSLVILGGCAGSQGGAVTSDWKEPNVQETADFDETEKNETSPEFSGEYSSAFAKKWCDTVDHIFDVMIHTQGMNESISEKDLKASCESLKQELKSGEITDEITAYYRLRKIVATSKMIHMDLFFADDVVRDGEEGLKFDVIWTAEGPMLFGISEGYEQYMGKIVTKIGGYTIQEFMDLASTIYPVETENGKKYLLYLLKRNALTAMGVIKEEQKVLPLTVKSDDGEETFDWVISDFSDDVPMIVCDYQLLPFTYQMRTENMNDGWNYSYQILEEKKAIYFQYLSCCENENQPFDDFFGEMLKQFEEHPDYEHLIIDVRWNRGGDRRIFARALDAYEEQLKTKKIDLILGHFTASAGCQVYEDLLQSGCDVTSYGEGTSGAVRNYTEIKFEEITETGLVLRYPSMRDQIPMLIEKYGDERKSIEPDIPVEIQRDDLVAGVDTIIERIDTTAK